MAGGGGGVFGMAPYAVSGSGGGVMQPVVTYVVNPGAAGPSSMGAPYGNVMVVSGARSMPAGEGMVGGGGLTYVTGMPAGGQGASGGQQGVQPTMIMQALPGVGASACGPPMAVMQQQAAGSGMVQVATVEASGEYMEGAGSAAACYSPWQQQGMQAVAQAGQAMQGGQMVLVQQPVLAQGMDQQLQQQASQRQQQQQRRQHQHNMGMAQAGSMQHQRGGAGPPRASGSGGNLRQPVGGVLSPRPPAHHQQQQLQQPVSSMAAVSLQVCFGGCLCVCVCA